MRKALALLLIAPLVAAPSQRPQPENPQTGATFKTGAKLVEVIVVAKDKRGPAAGLTKDDFTLFDNGNRRDIAFFSVRSVRDLAPSSVAPSAPLPPGVVSNRPNAGGIAPATQTVLLIDQIFTDQTNQVFAIQRISRFLDLRRKQDGIGIYTFGGGVHVVQDVTTDGDLLRRAAKRLTARDANTRGSDTTGMTAKEASAYLTLTLQERVLALKHAFQAIARHLANTPGRKNLVWITQGFLLYVCNDLICVDFRPDLTEAAQALNDANVALHAADPRGLIGALSGMTPIPNAERGGPSSPGQLTRAIQNWAMVPAGPSHIETMDFITRLTGGDVYYNTNGIEESFQKAVQYEDVTYSLGFYPPESAQDGQVHQLNVRVTRPGVSLRYRTSYIALKPGFESPSLPTIDQLLKDPLDATQVGLLAQAVPDEAQPGRYKVHVSVDLHDMQLYPEDGKWTGAVEIAFYVENSKSAQVLTRKIEIPENELASALARGIGFDHAVEFQGKNGQLHVAVLDKSSGAAGSLRIPLGKN